MKLRWLKYLYKYSRKRNLQAIIHLKVHPASFSHKNVKRINSK